jgi:hypothetical protein
MDGIGTKIGCTTFLKISHLRIWLRSGNISVTLHGDVKYVLLSLVLLNRHKSSAFECSGHQAFEERRRYKRYENAPSFYVILTLPVLFLNNGICRSVWCTHKVILSSVAKQVLV